MAIVLEFNLICKRFIDLKCVLQNYTIRELDITLGDVFCMDNWTWDNQQKLQDLSLTQNALEKEQIVTINLKCASLKDLGIYIEKFNGEYVYDLWINTQGYPKLDADRIDLVNEHYFHKFYQVFREVIREQDIGFRILGIGLETDFQYAKENSDVIKNSNNILAWIVNKDMRNSSVLSNYRLTEILGTEFAIFEKKDSLDV